MLCQFCNKNESDRTFVTSWSEMQFIVHVCEKCLEQVWRQAVASGHGEAFRAISGWWPGKENPREGGGHPFPMDVPSELKRRLRQNALQQQLREAVDREDYAEAARLQEELGKLETEREDEYTHEL